jgi:hypothetical protein
VRIDVPGLLRRIEERRRDEAFMFRLMGALERDADILARLRDDPTHQLCEGCYGQGESDPGVECAQCGGRGLVAVEG